MYVDPGPTGLAEAKSTLRETVLSRRDAMDTHTRAALSRIIIQDIVGLAAYRRSRVVMAYISFGTELQTADFIRDVLDQGKTLVLPRVNRARRALDLYQVSEPTRDLEPGVWGILEAKPDRCALIEPSTLDFILVPGLAFDAEGRRLGYGGGFYDRLLAGLIGHPPLVSGAFETQVVEVVPVGANDLPVDIVVTEGGHYRARAGRIDKTM